MSDTAPGVSDVLNPPAPVTPEAASAKMAELDASPEFKERLKNGDISAYAQREELWRLAHGMPAKPQPAVNEIDVLTQMAGRELAETQSRAESLRRDGLSEIQIYQYLNGRPIPMAERQAAERQLVRLKADKSFQQRLRDKDPSAIYEWRRTHVNLSMPTVSNSVDGTLQPEIVAWQRAHANTEPK